jgi:hypothetical protein
MLHRQLTRPQARHLQGQHRHETARLADPIAAAAAALGSVALDWNLGWGALLLSGWDGWIDWIGLDLGGGR